MIIKNHDIELKDTSASEMARFRQIMLSIWRQQIEDDKNSAEMHRYVNTIELKDSGATVSPLTSILLWIKKNIGNKAKELKLSSLPKNTFLDSLSDTYKGHFIKCNRFLFETIVDLKNIKFEASFRPVQTVFQLSIFNPQKSLVFRFETSTYEGLEYLAKFIGYDIDVFKRTITQQYKKEIAAAGNDKNKLDIIYEVIPDFILRTLKTDQQMYADIWRLLDQDISDTLGRDEDKAILNILKTLQKKDAKKLYEKLYERPLWVMKLYKTFSGDDRKNFVALIMDLCRYSKNGPEKNRKIYLPDGYWLSNVQLNVNWSNNMIVIENSSTLLNNFGNLMVSSSPTTGSKNPVGLKTLYKGGFLNPMDLITVKSVIGMDKDRKITTEAASNQVALFIKYTVDELSDEIFWNVINVASTLAGGYGAVRVLTIEGTGWLIKTAAILELSKATLDLVMLNDNAKKALREAGLGILVDNWTTISITADLTFLSLDGLFALAKYGNKGVKVLKEANQLDEAAHLESQTEKALTEIETQTGVDVSKMSEKELNDFIYREDDRPHSPTGKMEGRIKSHVNPKGEIEPANANGKTTVQQHIRGSEPVKSESPYTSFSLNKPGTGTNKSYGNYLIEVDIKKLEKDINDGLVKDVQILKNEEVLSELQEKIDLAQKKVDINPSKKNLDSLDKTKQDFTHSTRDKEVLIKGIVPSKYLKVKPQKK